MEDINIKDVQKKILEIAVYLDEFCKEHNITYYLMGGSALGAIRHNGFIPWDDDLDVFMTYDNYVKFIDLCKKYLDTERFYLQEENTEEWPMFFTKLRMNNTTFIEADTKDRNMHQGFFVDIMCLNNVSNNKLIAYIQYLSARLLSAQTLALRGYITSSKLKKMIMVVTTLVVRGPVKKALVYIVRAFNKKDTKFVGHFFGRAKFKNTSFDKRYLGKSRYVDFENTKLPVVEKVEEYLTIRFGDDYLQMPDQKTRNQYPVHAIYVNLEKNYDEFVEII